MKKKLTIYPGIEVPDTTTTYTDLRTALGLDNDIALIGNIGQFVGWKNHLDFIRTAELILKSNSFVHFIMCGNCFTSEDEQYRDSIRRYVADKQLMKSFTFMNFTNDMHSVYQSIDIIVHCALSEPFGRVVAESMAYGRPIVAYSAGGVSEIIEHGKTGYLVAPGDVEDMAGKCLSLINEPELAHRLGKKGKERIHRVFSVDGHISQMQDVLN